MTRRDTARHAVEIGWHGAVIGLSHLLACRSRLPVRTVAVIDLAMVVGLCYHVGANWRELTEPRWLPAR